MLQKIIEAAQRLVGAVTYDNSGAAGQGGNGGLFSNKTIQCSDELRLLLLSWKAGNYDGWLNENDIWPDYVIAFGVRIDRPRRMSAMQWMAFWECLP